MPAGHLVHVALAVGLLALSACGKSDAQSPGPPPGKAGPGKHGSASGPQVKPIAINVARAEARDVQRSVETIGSLLALEEVVVKTEQPGTVSRLFADLGDRVTRGQVLAEYDTREFELTVAQGDADLLSAKQTLDRTRATLLSSEASLRRARDSFAALDAEVARTRSQVDWARSELDRNTELWKKELIAARDVDNSRNQYNVAQAQLAVAENTRSQHPDQVRIAQAQVESDRAALRVAEAEVARREAALGIFRKRLGDTTVRAPLGGFIARRHLSAGEYVKDNTAVFTVVVLDPLKYTGTVPERYVPDLKTGQALQIAVEAYPGLTFPGQVTRLAPAVDVQTRTLSLEGRVANTDGRLRPGFFARGSVLTRKEASVAFVPADAVVSFVGITKVFVVASSTVEERPVRPGVRQGGAVEIIEGVKPGETVAVSNLSQLFNGAPVSVVDSRTR